MILLGATVLYGLKAEPLVVVEARSHAVVFVPAATLDLVSLAAPRHGLEPGGLPFSGIRFTPKEWADALSSLIPNSEAHANKEHVLRRLDVTPDCAVRLENYVDDWFRLDIEPRNPNDTTCFIAAVLTRPSSDTTMTLIPVDSHRVVAARPVTLVIGPDVPLHLRHVPVSRLRFETSDTGFVRSAILDARIELPQVAETGNDAHVARVGDVVRLGSLTGDLVEVVVTDTIRTVFKGRAARPVVERADLRPSLLEVAAHTPWVRLIVVVLVSGVTVVAAIYQVIPK